MLTRNIDPNGTDKLTYFCSKSGRSEQINTTNLTRSGARRRVSGRSSAVSVAPAHDIKLTCQYPLPGTHAAASNLLNLGRHLVPVNHCHDLRVSTFTEMGRMVA